MTAYESLLIAYGTDPEHAAVLAQREELYRLANREHPSYGKTADEQEKEH